MPKSYDFLTKIAFYYRKYFFFTVIAEILSKNKHNQIFNNFFNSTAKMIVETGK